jgi:hypothetical protein
LRRTITGGKQQVKVFNHIALNISNAYNVLHGNFLAPAKDTYLFSLYACSDSGNYFVLDLMRNGEIVGLFLSGNSAISARTSRTFIMEFKKGDDVYVSQGLAGGKSFIWIPYPHFSGVLLSEINCCNHTF